MPILGLLDHKFQAIIVLKVDPDGIVLKREDFDGHYVVMYHPRNDENPEIKGGDPDVDWQLWHEVVKGQVFIHRAS